MKLSVDQATDTGVVRKVNQDSYYVDPGGRFFIVADGMGGHAGGTEASQIATEIINQYLLTHWDSTLSSQELLHQALVEANEAILVDQQTHPERGEMGTTVVLVMLRQGYWCAHVGDSRLYQWRQGFLKQITHDHTWVALAVKSGEMSAEEARIHPWRNVLSQCLGRKDLNVIEIQPIEVESGDRLLLCSDGLTEEITDEEIGNYLSNSNQFQHIATNLITAAKEAGGSDNITVVVIECLDT